MFLLPRAGSDTVTFLTPWWWNIVTQRFPMMPAPVTSTLWSGWGGEVATSLSQPWRMQERGSHRAPVSRETLGGSRKTCSAGTRQNRAAPPSLKTPLASLQPPSWQKWTWPLVQNWQQ